MSDNKGKELTPEQLEKIAGGVSYSSSTTSSSSYSTARPSSSSWRPATSSSSARPSSTV